MYSIAIYRVPMSDQPLFPGPHILLAKGDFKISVLLMLGERPMHGYEIIQAFEERYHGFYKPSAGAVYPALQSLLRRDLVTVSGEERKKTYKITPKGQKLVRSREVEVRKLFRKFEAFIGPERAALMREIRMTGKLLRGNLREVTPEQASEIRGLVVDMRRKMMEIMAR